MVFRAPVDARLLEWLPEKRFKQFTDDATGAISDYQSSGDTAILIGASPVRLHADTRFGRPEVRIEFSGPSVLAGINMRPVRLDLIGHLVDAVLSRLDEEMPYCPSYEDLRVLRVDLARNFSDVQAIPELLLGVSAVRAVRARRDDLRRGMHGQWSSLTRGNVGRWLARGYDKSEQLEERASYASNNNLRDRLMALATANRGLLRWELQLHGRVLHDREIRGVDDLKPDDLYDLASEYFTRSRFDVAVDGRTQLRRALQALDDEGAAADARMLLAYLAAEGLGMNPPMGVGLRKEARRLARSFGLTPADLFSGDGERRRLDFESGCVIDG